MISVFGLTPLLISNLKPLIFSTNSRQRARSTWMENLTFEWQYVFSEFLYKRHVLG